MNSCIYRAQVMHHRFSPKVHRFNYTIFMFCIDLDEIDLLVKKFPLISRNRFNFFSFRDREHLLNEGNQTANVKEHVLNYLHGKGVEKPAKILLVTHLNVLGYNFNPVSFYYCYDQHGMPLCAIAEVQNTFKEMKSYFMDSSHFDGNSFSKREIKHFYVSPFIDLDAEFDFHLQVPAENLRVRIDDYKDGSRFFTSTLTGKRKAITTSRLVAYLLRFPLIPLQVMFLIHWNALLLWMKKIPYLKKQDNMHLQKEILRKYAKPNP